MVRVQAPETVEWVGLRAAPMVFVGLTAREPELAVVAVRPR
jgi:hypothetical protein